MKKLPRSSFVLYGATGYSGRLLARRALEAGLSPVLAGRNPAGLAELGRALGLDFRVLPLEEPATLASLLDRGELVLNAAGPFSATAPILQAVALAQGAHYLDLSGEVATLEASARAHQDARSRGVMLMPGVGFDVVPSDCLAVHVARGLGHVEQLSLAVFGMGPPSRGSARTMAEQAGKPILVRRAGELAHVRPGSGERQFEVNGETIAAVPVSWGDVVTSHVSTGAQDITVYFEATPELRTALAASRVAQALGAASVGARVARAQANLMPAAPRTSSERVRIVAEAKGQYGVRKALLWTPDVYTTTADAAVAVIKRVLAGDFESGFQTPGRLYGPDFVLSLPGIERMDVAG